MKRNVYINGLTYDALKRIEELAPHNEWVYTNIESRTFGDITLYDIALDENVIIKIHDDRLTLMLGGKIEFVEFNEFYAFVVS